MEILVRKSIPIEISLPTVLRETSPVETLGNCFCETCFRVTTRRRTGGRVREICEALIARNLKYIWRRLEVSIRSEPGKILPTNHTTIIPVGNRFSSKILRRAA